MFFGYYIQNQLYKIRVPIPPGGGGAIKVDLQGVTPLTPPLLHNYDIRGCCQILTAIEILKRRRPSF